MNAEETHLLDSLCASAEAERNTVNLTFDSNIFPEQNVMCGEAFSKKLISNQSNPKSRTSPHLLQARLQVALRSPGQKFIFSITHLLALLSSAPLEEGRTERPRITSDTHRHCSH